MKMRAFSPAIWRSRLIKSVFTGLVAWLVQIGSPAFATAPVVVSQSITTDEDSAVAITLEAYDPDGARLTYSITHPWHGTLSGRPPNLIYRPDTNYFGEDSLLVFVSSGGPGGSWGEISITILPINDPPVAVMNTISGVSFPGYSNLVVIAPLWCQSAAIALSGADSSDVDGNPLDYIWFDNGMLLINSEETTNDFALGTHEVTLLVSDGTDFDTDVKVIQVVSPQEALVKLIAELVQAGLPPSSTYALRGDLQRCLAAMNKRNPMAATSALKVFQGRLHFLNMHNSSNALLSEWDEAAQSVMDAILIIKPTRMGSHHNRF
jgi:hypothetical protein